MVCPASASTGFVRLMARHVSMTDQTQASKITASAAERLNCDIPRQILCWLENHAADHRAAGAADFTVEVACCTGGRAMSIAPTLRQYLADENIQYDEIPHDVTMTSTGTAEACHISGDRLAKGIVLRRDGGYMLAVLPASHHLKIPELKARLGDDIDMANETEIDRLFADCAHGAVPAIGTCYGLDLIVDDSIQAQPEIYMEAGDHQTLLHLSGAQFARLTANAMHGRFSKHD
jgi:Ala-tRNA(Pro) deacylase